MRAGVETPATPSPFLWFWQRTLPTLNEGRGRNPGNTANTKVVENHRGMSSLNEGRGRNPGNTVAACHMVLHEPSWKRSMRAGVETPATPPPVVAVTEGESSTLRDAQ